MIGPPTLEQWPEYYYWFSLTDSFVSLGRYALNDRGDYTLNGMETMLVQRASGAFGIVAARGDDLDKFPKLPEFDDLEAAWLYMTMICEKQDE